MRGCKKDGLGWVLPTMAGCYYRKYQFLVDDVSSKPPELCWHCTVASTRHGGTWGGRRGEGDVGREWGNVPWTGLVLVRRCISTVMSIPHTPNWPCTSSGCWSPYSSRTLLPLVCGSAQKDGGGHRMSGLFDSAMLACQLVRERSQELKALSCGQCPEAGRILALLEYLVVHGSEVLQGGEKSVPGRRRQPKREVKYTVSVVAD